MTDRNAATERFRAALVLLANTQDRKGFFASRVGVQLAADVRTYLVPLLLSGVRSSGSAFAEPNHLTQAIVADLCMNPRNAQSIAEASGSPFRYAKTLYTRAVLRDSGRASIVVSEGGVKSRMSVRIDSLDRVSGVTPLASTRGDYRDPAVIFEERHSSSPIVRATHLIVDVLAPRSPQTMHEELPELVERLSETPADPSGIKATEALQLISRDLSATTEAQLQAVAAIVWGKRPNRAHISLLQAFIRNPEFDPVMSPRHLLALRQYRTKVLAA